MRMFDLSFDKFIDLNKLSGASVHSYSDYSLVEEKYVQVTKYSVVYHLAGTKLYGELYDTLKDAQEEYQRLRVKLSSIPFHD